jgi:hypothetical protein
MKVFIYEYPIRCGNGAGIVIAESEVEAAKMIYEKLKIGVFDELEITEIDISVPQVIDHSWEE